MVMKHFIFIFLFILFAFGNSGLCNVITDIEKNNKALAQIYQVKTVECIDLSIEKCLQAQQKTMELTETLMKITTGLSIQTIHIATYNSSKRAPKGVIVLNPLEEENVMAFINYLALEKTEKVIASIRENNEILAQIYQVKTVECIDLSIEKCLQAQQKTMELTETLMEITTGLSIQTIHIATYNSSKRAPKGVIVLNPLEEENTRTFIDHLTTFL